MDTKTQIRKIKLMRLESPEQYLILTDEGDMIVENDLSFTQKQLLWSNIPVQEE